MEFHRLSVRRRQPPFGFGVIFAEDPLLLGLDGIVFDLFGNAYVTNNWFNQLLRIDSVTGEVEVVAAAGLASPAELAFGKTAGDRFTLYIANLAWNDPEAAHLVKIDLCESIGHP